jgi:hypothetical protein
MPFRSTVRRSIAWGDSPAAAAQRSLPLILLGLCALCGVASVGGAAHAAGAVPDNGGGTADLPIHLDYFSQSPMYIIDGLPPGTNLTIDAVLTTPTITVEQPGGSLGGTQSAAIGSGFAWAMQGTGLLAGYNRALVVPLNGNVASFPSPPGTGFEVHAAPRTPGNPVQSFDTDMFRLFGQLPPGDPDFDLLRVIAGTDFGLPSPGHTTLTQSGGNWAVDSFFDITYRIDFVGTPGGPFAGRSGSTTGTVRLDTGRVPEPTTLSLLAVGGLAVVFRATRRRGSNYPSRAEGRRIVLNGACPSIRNAVGSGGV